MEPLLLASSLLVVGAVLLDRPAARLARQTSLVAAERWETLSLVAIGAVELCVAADAISVGAAWLPPLRWCAACTVFSGWMARLGARRPHGAGWQFVVATLWGVLALPAAEVLFLQRGQSFEIHAARGGFLWILIAGGVVNTAPTRARIPGLLAALGQLILFAAHLPGLRYEVASARGAQCVALIALALLVAGRAWRTFDGVSRPPRLGLDGVWIDFRDAFGAWWALRVLEHVNAVATRAPWPVRLTWSGFQARENHDETWDASLGASATGSALSTAPHDPSPALQGLAPAQLAALRLAVWNLLRRFVAPEWAAERLGTTLADSSDQAD